MICPRCKTDNESYGTTCYKCGVELKPGLNGIGKPAEKIFSLDRYYLNQKFLTIKQKYYVFDEFENRLLFVEREFLKWVANIHFFTDDTKSVPVMSLIKKSGLGGIGDFNARFTLTLPDGQPLAIFQRKGFLSSFFRRTWEITYPDGRPLALALEDSPFMSLFRRYGPFGEWTIISFIITVNGNQVGTFTRSFTITDKYVLDLSADYQKTIDRRVAVALAVLLDTGERR